MSHVTSLPCIRLNSIDACGVDIAPFSAMPDEEEVMLLPCMPLTNGPGDNPESDLWTFNVKTPDVSDSSDPPPVMIDYVHPGEYLSDNMNMFLFESILRKMMMSICKRLLTDWETVVNEDVTSEEYLF